MNVRCVATAPPDSNCTFNWVQYRPAYGGRGSEHQSTGYTVTDCQNACEFDPRCVAVEWLPIDGDCWINTITNHEHWVHVDQAWRTHGRHYDLVSRCNFTAGQCFHDVPTFRKVSMTLLSHCIHVVDVRRKLSNILRLL